LTPLPTNEAARAWSGAFLASVGIICLTAVAILRRDVNLTALIAPIGILAVRGMGLVWNMLTTAIRPGRAGDELRMLMEAVAKEMSVHHTETTTDVVSPTPPTVTPK
jgi:hypothetical protein